MSRWRRAVPVLWLRTNPRARPRAAGLVDSGATRLEQDSARDSLSLLCDTRASAGTSAGVAPGTETVQQLGAAATCRLLPSRARATATRCSAGTGPWSLPCGLTVEPCFLSTWQSRLKRGHPEGNHLERSRLRKPDRRPAGLGDPASGARKHDLRSTVLDRANSSTGGDGTHRPSLGRMSAKDL